MNTMHRNKLRVRHLLHLASWKINGGERPRLSWTCRCDHSIDVHNGRCLLADCPCPQFHPAIWGRGYITRRVRSLLGVFVLALLVIFPATATADPPGVRVRDCKAIPSGGGYACVTAGTGEIVFCTSWDPGSGMAYGCTS